MSTFCRRSHPHTQTEVRAALGPATVAELAFKIDQNLLESAR